MSGVARTLLSDIAPSDIDALPEATIVALGRRLGRLLPIPKTGAPAEDRWLNAREAADYLSLTLDALHKHTSARTIPFYQDGPGCKLYFKCSELDAWRQGDQSTRPKCFQIASKRGRL